MLQNVDTPVPHGGRGASGGLQGFLPGFSDPVEQTVDIPAPGRGVQRGLQGFFSDDTFQGVFRTFPPPQKKRDSTSALKVETASVPEPMDAGCLWRPHGARGGGGVRGRA